MKTIVVSHQPTFLPIIRQLSQLGWTIITLTQPYAQELGNQGIEAKPLGAFGGEGQDSAFAWAGACISALSGLELNGAGPGPIGWLRQNSVPFYYPRLADMGMIVVCLENLKPDLVLLHNDVEPATRAVALWAKTKSVPCLHIPHAIYQLVNRGPLGTDVHDLVTASNIGVAGPFQRVWYEACGAEPANVRETGLPQFDGWATRQSGDQKKAKKLLGLDPNRPVVAYGGTWPQGTNAGGLNDEWQFVYFSFLEAANRLGFQAVVKCHPRGGKQNWDWHVQQATEAGLDGVVTPSHLEQVIDASDLFLAPYGSNVLLEAAHNPACRLATTHGYKGDRAVEKVPIDPDGMAEALGKLLTEEPRPTGTLLAKYLGDRDGLAWQRVVGYCEELA